MMKWFSIPVIFILLLSIHIGGVYSASKGPSLLSVGAKYNKATNMVRASFGNVKGVSKVTYTLLYDSNGIPQGAGGSITPGKKTSFSKDLYLGTCSGRVCVKHKNVKNLKLQVTLKYTNGKSSSKIYSVK